MPEVGNNFNNSLVDYNKQQKDSAQVRTSELDESVFSILERNEGIFSNSEVVSGELIPDFSIDSGDKIPNGHSYYEYKGATFDVYRDGDKYKSQFVLPDGVDASEFFDKFDELKPVIRHEEEPEEKPEQIDINDVLGVNGEIDEGFIQGATGDCWLLTAVSSLAQTEEGRQIIRDSITINDDNTVTVSFNGIGVSYTLTAEEILACDTDSNENDAYSNGDNDMLVLELATEKLWADIDAGRINISSSNPNLAHSGNGKGITAGGLPSQMLYYMTGVVSNEYYSKNMTDLDDNVVYGLLQQALDSGNTAINFGVYYNEHSAMLTNGSKYSLDLASGGHALSVTEITQGTVKFINPWDGNREYEMTWEEFANLGIGYMSSTNLDDKQYSAEMTDMTEGSIEIKNIVANGKRTNTDFSNYVVKIKEEPKETEEETIDSESSVIVEENIYKEKNNNNKKEKPFEKLLEYFKERFKAKEKDEEKDEK